MSSPDIALLTGGSDKPYALGIASALAARGVAVDFIGSDELDCAAVHAIPRLRFLNLRGDQREDAALVTKFLRVLKYYLRLVGYVTQSRVPVLHILWNNKFELFDRVVLMAYYRLLGKRVVLTAHNINKAARDGSDDWVNRQSLRVQYRLCHHIFVHTAAMKDQLVADFAVPANRVTVIPFGINDTIPRTGITRFEARQQLGIGESDRTLLFFGQIAPYKGLEYLVQAIGRLAASGERVRLLVAGKVKRGHEDYWQTVQAAIAAAGIDGLVMQVIRFVPDEQVEPFLVASDAVVIPYVDIFQSGVPFLAFSFGVPVIATDVGSLREDVTGETGVLCRARDAADLARAITEFYQSDLYRNREAAGPRIRKVSADAHSWDTVRDKTMAVYAALGAGCVPRSAAAGPVPAGEEELSRCRE